MRSATLLLVLAVVFGLAGLLLAFDVHGREAIGAASAASWVVAVASLVGSIRVPPDRRVNIHSLSLRTVRRLTRRQVFSAAMVLVAVLGLWAAQVQGAALLIVFAAGTALARATRIGWERLLALAAGTIGLAAVLLAFGRHGLSDDVVVLGCAVAALACMTAVAASAETWLTANRRPSRRP